MKQATYSPTSWEGTTRAIKQHFGWEVLTQESAKTILALYIKGVGVQKIINVLEETK